MSVELIQISEKHGAIYLKFQMRRLMSQTIVTIPYEKKEDGTLDIKLTTQTLNGLVEYLNSK